MKKIFSIQVIALLVSMIGTGIIHKFVLSGSLDPAFASDISQIGHLLLWLLALFAPFIIPSNSTRNEKFTSFILVWGFISTVFPMWDLNWSLNHASLYGATIEDTDKWLYMTYAMADSRFVMSESYVIVQEFLSGILAFIMVYVVYTFLRGKTGRAFQVFLILTCVKFYANAVFLGTEIVDGFEHIAPGLANYIKVFGQNGLWSVAPPLGVFMMYRLSKDSTFNVKETLREGLGIGRKKLLKAS